MSDILSNLLNKETLEKLFPIVMDRNNHRILDDEIISVLEENGFNEKYFGMYAYKDVIKALLVYLVTNKEIDKKELIRMLIDFNSEFYMQIAPSFKEINLVANGSNLDSRAYNSFANAFIIEAIFAAKSLKYDSNYKRYYLNLTLMITEFISRDLVSKYYSEETRLESNEQLKQPKALVRKKTEEQG